MLSSRIRTIIISVVAVIIAAVSYVLNMGWIRFFMIFLMIPFIHAAILIVTNVFMAKYIDKSKKMRWLNLLFILTYLVFYIFLPDGGDYGETYFFFGLIESDSLYEIALNISLIALLGHIVTLVLQIVLATKIRKSQELI